MPDQSPLPHAHPAVFALLKSLGFATGLLGSLLGGYFLFLSHTADGRLFSATGLALALAVSFATFAWKSPRPFWRRSALGALIACLAFGALLLARNPDGHTADGARVQHRYVGGGWRFRPRAFGNLLPELDQFRCGFPLICALDPLFTRQQANRLSALTTAIYDELEADPDFHALGSVMPEAYDELWAQDFGHGHYFLYVPRGLDRAAPHPAIVFLHGSGGNFKAYTWLLAKAADRLGFVVIAPSFGLGNWREPATSRVVASALEDARRAVALDQNRLQLMGLSNGGLGVSQAAATLGEQFQTLTFISPVIDLEAVASPGFARRWKGRPVFIVTGAADDRVPLGFVTEAAGALRAAGARVTLHPVEAADHFLFFSHEAQVLALIESWLVPPATPSLAIPEGPDQQTPPRS